MKLIDKSALVAEIERRKAINEKSYMQAFLNSNDNRDSFGYKVQENIEILSFIDTLEVKEVDLEKEIDFAMPSKYCWSGDGKVVYTKEQMRNFAKHFFELGLRLQTETNITFKYNIGESVKEYKAQKGE